MNGKDYYPTPISAFEPLLNFLPITWFYWEPACGDKRLVNFLNKKGFKADGNDIKNGYDFLQDKTDRECIITNPPFSICEDFIIHSLEKSMHTIMLLRLSFLGSQRRHNFFKKHPINGLFVLSKRPSFIKGKTDNSEYAWFCWSTERQLQGINHLI